MSAPELQRIADTFRAKRTAMNAAIGAQRNQQATQAIKRARVGQRNAFHGAEVSRLTADWVFQPLVSATQELRGDLRALRARSRDLCRNFSLAKRYLNYSTQNVVGPDGIRLHARVADTAGVLNVAVNRDLEAAWKEWSRPENASVSGRYSFNTICRLAYSGRARDGESLIRIWRGFNNPFGFSLQLIDPDQLDDTFYRAPGDGVNEIRMGIEIDAFERPVAYWIWSYHPNDYFRGTRERVRVVAEDIIHYHRFTRANQMRGVPDFHAVLIDQKMLAGYIEAELVAARSAASKMGFFSSAYDGENAPIDDPNTEQTDEKLEMEFEAGLMTDIGTKKFIPWDPQHPVAAFPPFVKTIQRSIAAGLDTNYHGLTGDMESISYSAHKAGFSIERDFWRMEQDDCSTMICRRVYLEFLRMAVLNGQVRAPSSDFKRVAAHEWQPRGWESPDPVKDIQAGTQEVALGVNSRRRLCAERGVDWDQIMAELAAEQEKAEELGLTITPAPAGQAPGANDGQDTADTAGNENPASADDASANDNSKGKRQAGRRRLGVIG